MMKKRTQLTFLDSLQKRFSPDSEQWLIACLDPYHDYQYDVEGLPDERVAPSVTQIHNQSYTLAAPVSAGAGNYDASVLYTGFNSPINIASEIGHDPGLTTQNYSSLHLWDSGAISTGTAFGALDIWAGAAGSTQITGAPSTPNDIYTCLGSNMETDRCRLIGVAIEISNTTAAIYKQGSVTTAMLPDTAEDSAQIRFVDELAAGVKIGLYHEVQLDRGVIQASTLQPLMAVPGSCTWPASEGVYAIPRMTKVPRDILSYKYLLDEGNSTGANTRLPILYGTDGKLATPEPLGYIADGASSSASVPLFCPYGSSGFSPIQIYFSGLSNQTTLTITFRTIVEYFPALTSPLLPLASPSPVFDPKVLALYCAVAAAAPYAVPVSQNAAGDYFRKVLTVLGKGLEMISPVFGEFAPLAAGAGRLATRLGKPKEKSKAVSKNEAGPSSSQSNHGRH